MESRKYFVEQVAKNILEHHAKEDSSFIFGISGKWGEGKTQFLGELSKELKKKDTQVKVYTVNPWKFSSDTVSFMRDFLKSLNVELSFTRSSCTAWFKSALEYFRYGNSLKNLEYDKSQNKLQPNWILGSILLTIIIVFCYLHWPTLIQSWITWIKNLPDIKWVVTILLVPILLSLYSKIIVVQKSSQAVSTIEQFDALLRKIIKKSVGEGNKIIVFVDDLDRVTPGTARNVLDNLRTFFDKSEITFVVTGDHTVLERYLGKELLPDQSIPEQLEEGRRFLKKIFNVYWRLPLPIASEVKAFVGTELTKRSADINQFFNSEQQFLLASYLEKYFEKNFRHVIRFLDTIVFTFQIIKHKNDVVDATNKNYFEELLKHPLLVVRVLMFQELCAPFFDAICKNLETLAQIEYATETKSTDKINSILATFNKDVISPAQKEFISKFIYEEPRFYKEKSLVVSNIEPFLFLAADASLGDQRGPSSEDFMSTINSGDPELVKKSILSMGDEKALKCVTEFKAKVLENSDANIKNQFVRTLISAIADTAELLQSLYIFLKGFSEMDFNFYDQLSPEQRTFTLARLWSVLDRCKEDAVTGRMVNLSVYKKSDDIITLLDQNYDSMKLGNFSARTILQWIINYYPSNNNDAINRMHSFLADLKKVNLVGITEKEIAGFYPVLIDAILNDSNPDNRLKRYEILKYFAEGTNAFKIRMMDEILACNEDIYQWLNNIATVLDPEPIITLEILKDSLKKNITIATDKNTFVSRLSFASNKVIGDFSKLWNSILKNQDDNLLLAIQDILSNSHYQNIAPPNYIGKDIFIKFVDYISKQDDTQKNILISLLQKTNGFWKNVESISLKAFDKIKKETKDDQVKESIELLKTSWYNKTI